MIGDSSVRVGIENTGMNVFAVSSCASEEMFWSAEFIIIKNIEGNGQENFRVDVGCLSVLQVWQLLIFG